MRGRIFLEKRIQLLKARLEGRSGKLAERRPVRVVALVSGADEGVGAEGCGAY